MSDLDQQLARQQFKPVPPEWRAGILDTAARAVPAVSAKSENCVPWWRLMIWPSPQAWATLAAVWVLIILGHFTMPSVNSSKTLPTTMAFSAGAAEAWREQQRLLAELFPQEQRAEPPKGLPLRRRTERESGHYFV